MNRPRRCEYEFHTIGTSTIIDWDQYAIALEKYIEYLNPNPYPLCQECGENEAHYEDRCTKCAQLPDLSEWENDLPF